MNCIVNKLIQFSDSTSTIEDPDLRSSGVMKEDQDITAEALDSLIHRRDTEASVLLKEIVELKRFRNQKSLSGRLTNEILKCIFTLLARDKMRLVDGWDWICVAHVCHSWREIAMNTKEMWSTIICSDKRYSLHRANLHLKLSGDTDLVVILNGSHDVSVDRIKKVHSAILKEMRRIVELHVSMPENLWEQIAENLERFHLYCDPKIIHIDVQTRKRSYVTMRRIQTDSINPQNEAPSDLLISRSLETLYLQNLALTSAQTRLKPFSTRCLVNLTLTHVTFCSSEDIYTILDFCDLRLLSLTECRAKDSEPKLYESYRVSMCYLEELCLRQMDIKEITPILRYIKFPDTCNIALECNPDWNISDTFGSGDFTVLLRNDDCDVLDILMLSYEMRIDLTYIGEVTTKVSIHLNWTDTEPLKSTLDRVCKIVEDGALNTATKVRIQVDADKADFIERDVWGELLCKLRKTKSLGISFRGENPKTEEEFAIALRRRDDKKRLTLCPSLKHLSMRFVKCTADFILELEHSLGIRKDCKKPVKSLWMYDVMGIKEEGTHERNLLRFVQYLHWERFDDDFQSEDSDYYDTDEEKDESDDDEEEGGGKGDDDSKDEDSDDDTEGGDGRKTEDGERAIENLDHLDDSHDELTEVIRNEDTSVHDDDSDDSGSEVSFDEAKFTDSEDSTSGSDASIN